MARSSWSKVLGCALAASLFVVGCGSDDDDDTSSPTTESAVDSPSTTTSPSTTDAPATTDTPDTAAPSDGVEVSLTEASVSGMPAEVPGGTLTLIATNDGTAPMSLDFIQGTEGSTGDDVAQALMVAESGGPIAEPLIGFVGGPPIEPGDTIEFSVTVTPGTWYAQAFVETEEPPPDEGGADATTTTTEAAPSPPAFTPFTVTDEGAPTELDAESTITAADYRFDIDITAGADEMTFNNDGPDQFHHAIFFALAEGIDEDAARAAAMAFLEAPEDAPPPPEVDFEADPEADTNVVSPELAVSQPQGDFEEGRTYAVFCFIPDRTGGPPHAIAYDMWDVFTVGG